MRLQRSLRFRPYLHYRRWEQLAEAAWVHQTVRQYLREVEEQNPGEEPVHEQDQVSTTDPDSTYATKGGTPARLGFYDNYFADRLPSAALGQRVRPPNPCT